MADLRTILNQTLQTANAGFATQKQGAKNQIKTAVSDVTKQWQNKIPEIKKNTKKEVIKTAKKMAVNTVLAPARYVRDKIDRGADMIKSSYFKTRRDWDTFKARMHPAAYAGGKSKKTKKSKKSKKENKYTKKEKKKINGVTKVIYTKKNSKKLYVKSKGRMMNLKKYKNISKKR